MGRRSRHSRRRNRFRWMRCWPWCRIRHDIACGQIPLSRTIPRKRVTSGHWRLLWHCRPDRSWCRWLCKWITPCISTKQRLTSCVMRNWQSLPVPFALHGGWHRAEAPQPSRARHRSSCRNNGCLNIGQPFRREERHRRALIHGRHSGSPRRPSSNMAFAMLAAGAAPLCRLSSTISYPESLLHLI